MGGLAGFNSGTIKDSYAAGAVTGASGSQYLGGLVGSNVGTIHNTYSTGLVTANGALNVGGFLGRTTVAIVNSFFDTDSSGQSFAVGDNSANTDVTAATTPQLTSQSFILAHAPTAPTFDFTNNWTTVGDTLTPQLIGLPPTALPNGSGPLDTISGTAYLDQGTTFSAGVLIEFISGGSVLGSTTTDSSGNFHLQHQRHRAGAWPPAHRCHGQGQHLLSGGCPCVISGIDLWGNTVRVTGDAASNASLATTIGSLPLAANGFSIPWPAAHSPPRREKTFSSYNNYDAEGNITARGSFITDSASMLTGSAAVTLTGSDVSMGGTFNRTGALTVASTTGAVTIHAWARHRSPATASGLTVNSAQAVLVSETYLSIGTGGVTMTGTGYTSTVDTNGEANGINFLNASITSAGALSLTGTAGYTSNGNGGLIRRAGRIYCTDGQTPVAAQRDGQCEPDHQRHLQFQNITSSSLLTGVLSSQNVGNASNIVSVTDGRLVINGTVSQGSTTADSKGVYLDNGPTVQATGAGLVTITGTESAANAVNRTGIDNQGSTVSVVNGALN